MGHRPPKLKLGGRLVAPPKPGYDPLPSVARMISLAQQHYIQGGTVEQLERDLDRVFGLGEFAS